MTVSAVDVDPDKGITANDRPADRLADDPVVESVADLNRALREMAFMVAHAKQINDRRSEALKKVNVLFDAELMVDGPDGALSYQNRETLLLNAIEKFADREYTAAKDAKTKRSVKLSDGVIKWQKARDAVDYLENKSAKTVVSWIDKTLADDDDNKRGLLRRLADFLQRLKVSIAGRDVPLAALVKLEPTVEKTRIRDAYESGTIDLRALETLGFAFVEGGDYFKAEPNEYKPPDVT